MSSKKPVRAVRSLVYTGRERRVGKDRRLRGSDVFPGATRDRRVKDRRTGGVPPG